MNEKLFSLIRISLKFVPKDPIDNKAALTQFTDKYAAQGGDELN